MNKNQVLVFAIALLAVAVPVFASAEEPIKLDFDRNGALAMMSKTQEFRENFGPFNGANYLNSLYDSRGVYYSPETVGTLIYPLYIKRDVKPDWQASQAILDAENSQPTFLPASTKPVKVVAQAPSVVAPATSSKAVVAKVVLEATPITTPVPAKAAAGKTDAEIVREDLITLATWLGLPLLGFGIGWWFCNKQLWDREAELADMEEDVSQREATVSRQENVAIHYAIRVAFLERENMRLKDDLRLLQTSISKHARRTAKPAARLAAEPEPATGTRPRNLVQMPSAKSL